jgi:hypothetical protein
VHTYEIDSSHLRIRVVIFLIEMDFVKEFANKQSNSLARLKESTDLSYLKQELVITQKRMPDCAAESLFRTNKISILETRIKELKDASSSIMHG